MLEFPRLTLRQLQVFVAVAACGSTTTGSARLALSQSATSAAVNELERVLGVRLFDRIGNRLRLNDSGRMLVPRARALLDGAADVERLAHAGQAPLDGLRVGASTTLGSYVLPRLLAQFLSGRSDAAAPAWSARIVVGNTAAVCQSVAAFELDVGLIEGPCHQPTLAVHPWLRDRLVIVAARDLLTLRAARRRGSARIPLTALRDQVWLLREPGSGTREATDQLLLPKLKSFPRSIELASSEAIKQAAAEGLGIACLSYWVVRDLVESGRLVEVSTSVAALQRQCYWVVHRDKQPSKTMEAFLSVLTGQGRSP